MSANTSLLDQIIQKAWEDAEFKKKLLANPKAAVKKAFGTEVPDSLEVEVVEETATKKYFVLPQNPKEVASTANADFPMWS